SLEVSRQRATEILKEASKNIQSTEEQLSNAHNSMLTEEEYRKLKDVLYADDQVKYRYMQKQSMIDQEQQHKKNTHAHYKQGKKVFAGLSGLAIVFVIIAWFSNIPWFYHGAILSAVVGWMQWYFKRKDYMNYEQKVNPPSETSDEVLDETERAHLQEKIDQHNRSMEGIDFLNERREEFQQLYTQRESELQHVLQAEEKVNKQIEEELFTYPFLDKIELPYWEEIGLVLRDVQSLRLQEEDISEQLLNMKHARNDLEQKIRAYAQNLDENHAHESIPMLLAHIDEYIHDDVKNRERMENLSHEQQEALERHKQQSKKIDHISNEINAIFQRAEVQTREEFQRKYETYIDQKANVHQMNQAKEQLIAIFTPTTWNAYVHQDIDAHTVQYEQSSWSQKVSSYEKELEDIRSSLATSQAAMNHLERKDSRSYSEQMHTFEREQEVLQQLAKDWATYQVAYSTLQQTKQTFMRKHVQSLFEKATEHFSYITNKRYKTIHTDLHKGEMTVIDDTNIPFSPIELSKGTRDQLYIAIRLAMGQHTQEKMPFPFIFDDSFVHFDANRTERMIQLMLRVSMEQQVIVFTCKNEIEEIIQLHTKDNEVSWVRIQ